MYRRSLPESRAYSLFHTLIERLAQVAYDMKLIEQNCRLRCVRVRGSAKRLLHVHYGKTDAPALLAKPLIKLGHAGFRAVRPTEPDRPLTKEVTDHDAVVMALADRDLVDPDHPRPRSSHLGKLGVHVLLVQLP